MTDQAVSGVGNLGPLKYDIEVSSSQIEAGKDFSLFVKVTNPYSIPVDIHNLSTRLPTEFIDRTAEEKERAKHQLSDRIAAILREAIGEKIPDLTDAKENLIQKYLNFFKEVVKAAPSVIPFGSVISAGYSLAEAARASTPSPKERILSELDQMLDPCHVERIAEEVGKADKPGEALKQASIKVLEEKVRQIDQAGALTLQPGDSTAMVFTLRTRRALFFSPSSYNLNIEIQYATGQVMHHDAIDYKLSVRASLGAIVTGAAIGSIGGYLLRDIFQVNGLMTLIAERSVIKAVEWLLRLFGSLLLAAVAVIAFARKKDSQPILTIEDFWGGLFIGVVAGYMGKSFLDQILTTGTPASGT